MPSFALASYCNGGELVICTAEGCWPAVVVVCGWVGGLAGAPRSGPVIDRSRLHTKRQDKKRFVVLIWISMALFLLASSERTKTISMRKYELGHLETTVNGKSNSTSTIVTGASFQILFMMHKYTMTLLYVSAFCKSGHLVWKNDCIKKQTKNSLNFNFILKWFALRHLTDWMQLRARSSRWVVWGVLRTLLQQIWYPVTDASKDKQKRMH